MPHPIDAMLTEHAHEAGRRALKLRLAQRLRPRERTEIKQRERKLISYLDRAVDEYLDKVN